MALSSSYDFTLTAAQLIAASFRKIGISSATAMQNAIALQSLEIILKSLSAKGFNLTFPWVQEWTTQALVASTATYTLNQKIVNVANAFIRDSDDYDTPVDLIGYEEYARISDKTVEDKPNRLWMDKQNDGIVVYLYPVPDDATDVLHLLAINKFQDVDASGNNIDINSAWFKALIYLLAAELVMEPEIVKYANSDVKVADLVSLAAAYSEEAKGVSGDFGSTSIIPRRR